MNWTNNRMKNTSHRTSFMTISFKYCGLKTHLLQVLKSSKFAMFPNIIGQQFFLNLVESSPILIVNSLFWLFWHQSEFSLIPNKLGKSNCNINLVQFNDISRSICPCVCFRNIGQDVSLDVSRDTLRPFHKVASRQFRPVQKFQFRCPRDLRLSASWRPNWESH